MAPMTLQNQKHSHFFPSKHIPLTAWFLNMIPNKFVYSCIAAPLSLALALNSPLPSLAIPPPNNTHSAPTLPPPSTPYNQSKSFQTGLENGKIRVCPSINPGCVSTNPKSSSFSFPLEVPDYAIQNATERLRDAILKTQKNAKIKISEATSDGGQYLEAEVDGGFGRDVMEFLVKNDVVAYRTMATKVIYIYPFTTAFGDSKGQLERVNKIVEELGWYAPSFESMESYMDPSSEEFLD